MLASILKSISLQIEIFLSGETFKMIFLFLTSTSPSQEIHVCPVEGARRAGKGNPFFKLEREGHSRVYEIQCFWIFEPGFETGFQDPAVFVTTIGDYLKRIFVFAHGEIYRV